jgi:hypothetical protein
MNDKTDLDLLAERAKSAYAAGQYAEALDLVRQVREGIAAQQSPPPPPPSPYDTFWGGLFDLLGRFTLGYVAGIALFVLLVVWGLMK